MGNTIASDCRYSSGVSITSDHEFSITSNKMHQMLIFSYVVLVVMAPIKLKFQCDFSECLPVIGLTRNRECIDNLNIRINPDLIYWSPLERKIFKNGKVYQSTGIKCTPGCSIIISWIPSTNTFELQMIAASGDEQRDQVTVEFNPAQYWPMLGAIKAGWKGISFELLGNNTIQYCITTFRRFQVIGGKMSVSANGRTISRPGSVQGNSVAVLDQVITTGLHSWKLRVNCDFGASICIGLAIEHFKMRAQYLRDPLKHIYHHKDLMLWRSYRGLLYKNGKQLAHALEALGWQNNVPVIVGLKLDMNKGTLEIYKDGRLLGVAFDDIQGPVQPAVTFYASYEKEVELVEYYSSEDIDVVQPDGPSQLLPTQPEEKPCFDSRSIFGSLSITDDGMTLRRSRDHSGNGYCFLNQTLQSGTYRWSFVIQSDQGASTCVGVARVPVHCDAITNIYTSPDLYVLRSFQGMLYCEGKELPQRFSEFWVSGALVELCFEVNKGVGTLRCSINGEPEKVAFTNIQPPVRPIVGFYAGMDKMTTLIHFEHKSTTVAPLQLEVQELNDLNITADPTFNTPLSILLQRSELSDYYDTCMVCGAALDVIALPCKHSTLCANHLVSNGTEKCLICEQLITGTWNILLD